MTEDDQITHLKAQIAEANKAIRELNERACSHLRASQDTVQALKLELDKANAKLRELTAYKNLLNADKQVERQRVLLEKVFLDLPPYDESQYKISQDFVDQLKGCIQSAKQHDPLASTENQS